VKSLRETQPDFGFVSGPDDVQRYVVGSLHVVDDVAGVELAGVAGFEVVGATLVGTTLVGTTLVGTALVGAVPLPVHGRHWE
jgi:hypothetical protein